MATTILRAALCAIIAGLSLTGAARANPSMMKTFNFNQPAFIHPHHFATTNLVIQVSANNPAQWALALNSAQNVLNYFGADRVQVVIVAFGPGLALLLATSPEASRIASMDQEGIEFDACHNTMEAFKRTTGHLPDLVPQAVIVPAGIVRIMQLQTHGFSYIKP